MSAQPSPPPQTRAKLIRIHLASGIVLEATPDQVSTNPAIGAFVKHGNSPAMPIPPVVIMLREKSETGELIYRRFFGASLEIVEEEARVVEVPRPSLVPG